MSLLGGVFEEVVFALECLENLLVFELHLRGLPLLFHLLKVELNIICEFEQVIHDLGLGVLFIREGLFVVSVSLQADQLGFGGLRLQHCLDLCLRRLDHLLDQLSLEVEELNSEPDVLDVLLTGDHKVETVESLYLLNFLVRFLIGLLGALAFEEEFLG